MKQWGNIYTVMMQLLTLVLLLPIIFCKEKTVIFEGDIVLDKDIQDIIEGKTGLGYEGKMSRKWPNGEIPYIFDANFDSTRKRLVKKAISEYSHWTCVNWVPRTHQKNFVRFVNGAGCRSSIGMVGKGRQDISLGKSCTRVGTAIHEMMHAAGFFHEQSRRDRDAHVIIKWDNIRLGMEANFMKYDHGEADTLGEPYDLDSIMHYHRTAYSTNRKPTIVAKCNEKRRLGNSTGFSLIDIKQLNKMYPCDKKPVPTILPSKPPKTLLPTEKTKSSTQKQTPSVTLPPSGCKDKLSSCSYWKTRGFCTSPSFKKYMKENCCKSCQ